MRIIVRSRLALSGDICRQQLKNLNYIRTRILRKFQSQFQLTFLTTLVKSRVQNKILTTLVQTCVYNKDSVNSEDFFLVILKRMLQNYQKVSKKNIFGITYIAWTILHILWNLLSTGSTILHNDVLPISKWLNTYLPCTTCIVISQCQVHTVIIPW